MKAGLLYGDSIDGEVVIEPGRNDYGWHAIAAIYGLFSSGRLVYSQNKSGLLHIAIEINTGGKRSIFKQLCTVKPGRAYQYTIMASGDVWSFGFNDHIAGYVAPTPIVGVFYKPINKSKRCKEKT